MPRPSFSSRAARRLLLVGYGQRGRQWQSARRRRRDFRVVGVVDPDAAALEAARQEALSAGATLADGQEDNLLTVAALEAAVQSEGLGRPVTLSEVGNTAGVPLATRAVAHG